MESPASSLTDGDRTSKIKRKNVPFWAREDVWVFAFGLSFLACYIGLIWVIGEARGWDAASGYTHNTSATSRQRFLSEPHEEEPGVFGRYGTDATSRWYYWKLPPWQVTMWTRLFPWLGYALHQISIWGTIYYGQMLKAREPLGPGRYSTKLMGFNWVALGLNVFFHLIHLISTHTTYDGTAQDTPVASSQSSVIVLLMLVLIMEYKDRGLTFGWPTKSNKDTISTKLRLDHGPVNLIRRFHGYAFAWAAVYTFWFHPMENTFGHVLGLTYTFVILLQGSLMYTNFHVNRGLRLFQESFVMIHGGLVASQTGGPSQMGAKLWPIFVFGPGMMFCITHVFTLTFWKRLPRFTRFIPVVIMLAISTWFYSWIPDANGRATRFKETIRMPAFHMIMFLYGYGILRGLLAVERLIKGKADDPTKEVAEPGLMKTVLFLLGSLFIYGFHSGLAAFVHYRDPHMNLILMMNGFVAVYIFTVMVSFMLLKQVIPIKLPQKSVIESTSSNGIYVDEMGKRLKDE